MAKETEEIQRHQFQTVIDKYGLVPVTVWVKEEPMSDGSGHVIGVSQRQVDLFSTEIKSKLIYDD